MADGSIKFDTGIETSGFEQDARTLKQAADACARSVEDAGKRAYNAFSTPGRRLDLERQIAQTEEKIRLLIAEMEALGNSTTVADRKMYNLKSSTLQSLNETLTNLQGRLSLVAEEEQRATHNAEILTDSLEEIDEKQKRIGKSAKKMVQ